MLLLLLMLQPVQIADDSTRIKELQDNVLNLTKQVQTLLPLQPRVTMAEAERESLAHRVERLQEQYNLAQRQLEQAAGREAELRVGLEGYKQEHAQLLANNTQLLEQNQALKKKSQVGAKLLSDQVRVQESIVYC
jgi:chromosome segregation ATPase